MASYISNTPISGPLWNARAVPDADMNGIGWSFQWGMVFGKTERDEPIRLPIGVSPRDYV